eukprot:6425996-Amphidinium_carterae.1
MERTPVKNAYFSQVGYSNLASSSVSTQQHDPTKGALELCNGSILLSKANLPNACHVIVLTDMMFVSCAGRPCILAMCGCQPLYACVQSKGGMGPTFASPKGMTFKHVLEVEAPA